LTHRAVMLKDTDRKAESQGDKSLSSPDMKENKRHARP
jgi:hypothetical protein